MVDKSKRILWVLQHRTLLKTEVPMLRRLGYEVFVPKIFPDDMRSSATTYEYDESLTIPPEALAILNQVDFYADDLSPEAVEVINEYFGTACMIIWRTVHLNLFRHFTGVFLHRAFGLSETDRYYYVLQWLGRDGVELLNAIRDRYWFAACYEGLRDVEPPLIADREAFLPLALPGSFVREHADTWVGGTRQLLFICPDINVDLYTRDLYDHFKESYGHLPHVIVGRQQVPVDDPHVIGFVDDDTLMDLMRTSTAMIYPSHERRHLFYHPIEAATIGLPVIFYRDSILGEMFDVPPVSAVIGDEEARSLAERLLDGDAELLERVRAEQHVIAEAFTEAHCERIWSENLITSGVIAALESAPGSPAPGTGWNSERDGVSRLVSTELLRVPTEPIDETPIEKGIDLRHPNLSTSIDAVGRIGHSESFGRWLIGATSGFLLRDSVSGRYEVEILGGTVEANFGQQIEIRLGDATVNVRFTNWFDYPRFTRAVLDVLEPARLLTISADHVWADEHGREISISMTRLRIRPQPSRPVRAVRALRGPAGRTYRFGLRALRSIRRRTLKALRPAEPSGQQEDSVVE